MPLGLGIGPADFSGAIAERDFDNSLRLGVEAGFQTVHLHDQHRPGVERKAEVKGLLHGSENQVVEQFQSTGNDAGGDNLGNRIRRLVHGLEDAQQGAIRIRVAR